MSSTNFKKIVWAYYKKHGRHGVPWRKTRNPYKILVSEIMLQQTQVKRVIPFHAEFTRRFPTIQQLAQAPLSEVLKAWQGLGYNRRAKYLHEAAKTIVARHAGRVPREKEALMALPGVGHYTASAVRAFAWNEPDVFIETNIRTAYIHHFFPQKKNIPDSALVSYMKLTLSEKKAREWYCALMDYGAHLKHAEGNAARRSAHHAKQKPFKGSDREVRGAILKTLARGAKTRRGLFRALPFPEARAAKQLAALAREGMVRTKKARVVLAD